MRLRQCVVVDVVLEAGRDLFADNGVRGRPLPGSCGHDRCRCPTNILLVRVLCAPVTAHALVVLLSAADGLHTTPKRRVLPAL